jgi:hypothetical protein
MRPLPLKRREIALLGLLGLALAIGAVFWLRGSSRPLAAAPAPSGPIEALPRIDLARLGQQRSDTQVGRRDLFEYGTVRGKDSEPSPEAVFTPPPTLPPTPVPGPPAPVVPRLPPLNVKYVGSLERQPGLRVAVLLTDRNEILTGQAGEVVANRYRIVKIGFESVDLQEVGTGETRRIPLRGN